MKTKARDIIHGWPKGRSTSGAIRFIGLPPQARKAVEIIAAAAESVLEDDYREQQKAMVYAQLEAYRSMTYWNYGRFCLEVFRYRDEREQEILNRVREIYAPGSIA